VQVPAADQRPAIVVFGKAQTKFAASSTLPEPLYVATCGYGHTERARATPCRGTSPLNFVTMSFDGAMPFCTTWFSQANRGADGDALSPPHGSHLGSPSYAPSSSDSYLPPTQAWCSLEFFAKEELANKHYSGIELKILILFFDVTVAFVIGHQEPSQHAVAL